MFSVITNLVDSNGSPNSHMQDAFGEKMHAVYGDRTNMAIEMVSAKRSLKPGDKGAIITLLSRVSTSRATKQAGELPVSGESDEYNYVVTPDEREYLDQHFDWDKLGETRYPAMAERGAQEVQRAKNDRQKRFVHTLWKTAQLSAISGFDAAPVLQTLSNASYTSIDAALPLSDTGAELMFKSMVQVETAMTNRDVILAPKNVWFMRNSAFDPLKFGNRTTSMNFNSGADLQFGLTPFINGNPIIVIPDMFWPSTSAAYTDSNFSHYDTDGRIDGGTNGTPVAFLVNYGDDLSPIVEVESAVGGGIVAQALSEPYRRVDTVRVHSRYAFHPHRRFTVGAISVKKV